MIPGHAKAVWDNNGMRIDLEKLHHFSSIGTFLFTVCILVATVWPLLPHAESATPAVADQEQQAQNVPATVLPAKRPMTVWIWPSLLALAIVVAGVINFKAAQLRTKANELKTHKSSGLSAAPRLEIVGIWENADVAHEQVIYGTATPEIPADSIELRVFAGGMWHSQGKATERSGDKWQRTCYFGNPDSPAGSRYKLVAIAPKTPLGPKITELPTDILKSEVVSVIRSTPAIQVSKAIETRDNIVPTVGLALDYVVMEPYDSTPGRSYPRKLRVYFRENVGDSINVGRATWFQESVGIQKGQPFGCHYELEKAGAWINEGPEKTVAENRRMRLYVGLDASIAEDDLQRLMNEKRLGTLMIPAEVSGVKLILKIKL